MNDQMQDFTVGTRQYAWGEREGGKEEGKGEERARRCVCVTERETKRERMYGSGVAL